jgi:thymidine phosphorylase
MTTEEARAAKKPAQLIQKCRGRKIGAATILHRRFQSEFRGGKRMLPAVLRAAATWQKFGMVVDREGSSREVYGDNPRVIAPIIKTSVMQNFSPNRH